MRNRGPDAQVEIDSFDAGINCAADFRFRLGHARLSIVDLSSAANQPMSTKDGRYWIVFNGEIYNHVELRAQLEGVGHRFQTKGSDTEALLMGYVQWGKGLLERLNGMFAFVVVDAQTGTAFGARDRMGIKPFFFRKGKGSFEFASEIRALNGPKEIRLQAVREYFHFLQAAGPGTFFEGIEKLEASECFSLDAEGNLSKEVWWHPLENGTKRDTDPEAIHELLRDSVRLRLQADVPVGAYLSGGIDSSLISAIAAQMGSLKTFSFGFDTAATGYKSELPFARQVSEHIGSEHHEVFSDKKTFLDAVHRSFDILDEPIADTACAPLLLLSELARKNGVKVMLGGEGADELFLGYREWWDAHRVYQFWNRLPKPLRPLAAASFAAMYGKRKPDWNGWFQRLNKGQMPMWGGIDALVRQKESRILHPDLLASTYDPYEVVRRHMLEEAPVDADYFQRIALFDLRFRLPEQLLARIDRMSMAASVEARVPFLDHRIVETALMLPLDMQGNVTNQKALLKELATRYLPEKIINRPKDGFTIPLSEVMSTSASQINNSNSTSLFLNQEFDLLRLSVGESWSLFALNLWVNKYEGRGKGLSK
jgi:asparagine synthase (glutamine-hydrolysing)